jgi:hypothetical protein
MEGVDLGSFRVVRSRSGPFGWGMDNNYRYQYGNRLQEHYREFWDKDAVEDVT